MGIFRSRAALQIGRQAVDYYVKGDHYHLDLPVEVFTNLEAVDQNRLKQLVTDFFSVNRIINQDIYVFYNSDAVFEKPFVRDEGLNDNLKQFFDTVPFSPEKLLKTNVDQEATVLAIAVNGELFNVIKPIAEFKKNNIILAVPLTPLGYKEFDRKVFSNKKKLLEYCLWKNENEKNNNPKVWVEVLALFGFVALGAFVAYNFLIKPKTLSPVVVNKPSAEGVNVATAEAQQSLFKGREELLVKVLNGSGRAGMAGKVKDLLLSAGFKNVETGNASESAKSLLNLSAMVATDDAELVRAKLADLAINTASASASASAGMDIEIVIGIK